jgi:transcriptional regulator of acetoin/glycerol metabolism
VVLADRESCTVDARFGQPELEAPLASVGAVPGKTSTEATTGTNSIATVAETHSGVAVHVEEHYLESFKRFACFGAPIRDPSPLVMPGSSTSPAAQRALLRSCVPSCSAPSRTSRRRCSRTPGVCSGNKVHAARELGISRNTLYRRVREPTINVDVVRGQT